MKTFEEIQAVVRHATSINDADGLLRSAEELEALDTQEALAAAHNARGSASRLLGSYSEALEHFRRALEVYTELGDRASAALITGNIGTVHWSIGSYAEALEHYHQALEVHTELGDRMGMASATGNIGLVLMNSGHYSEALEHYHRALEMHTELGDRAGVAGATSNIGTVHTITGSYAEALKHFHLALEVHTELGDRMGVAIDTGNIGNIHGRTGSYAEALECYRLALEAHMEVGDRKGVARITGNIGTVHLRTDNYSEALEYYQRAREMFTELGDRQGIAGVTSGILNSVVRLERYAEAEVLLFELDSMQISDPAIVVSREIHRALIHEHHGHLEAAKAALIAALEIADRHAIAESRAKVHQRLRELAQRSNDFAAYIEHNNEYQRIIEEIIGKETTQKMAMIEAERKMEAERREREKERALLYGTLPKEVAERMIRGEVINDQFDSAAVLFADIVGFTIHSSSLHPAEVTSFLEEVYRRFDAICEEHGVTKVKTIGDSYLCFAHAGNAERGTDIGSMEASSSERRAASAAERIAAVGLAMQQAEFYWPTATVTATAHGNSNCVQFRIGIHFGPVTAGVIGTQRMQYDVWGDTVNVASRMESTGEPGRIQVSAAFATALRDGERISDIREDGPISDPRYPILRERGEVSVKGKGLMTTYWLEEA